VYRGTKPDKAHARLGVGFNCRCGNDGNRRPAINPRFTLLPGAARNLAFGRLLNEREGG